MCSMVMKLGRTPNLFIINGSPWARLPNETDWNILMEVIFCEVANLVDDLYVLM